MDLEANIRTVEEKIDAACRETGRARSEVELVAVTKTHPPETIRQAMRLGLRIFGENKVQEARAKIPEVGGGARWDFLGHLQTNKARNAVDLFELIHAVDSLRVAQAVEKAAADAGKVQRVLIEVNVSGERSKFGVAPDAVEALLTAANAMPHLAVEGFMTMAPYSDDPVASRPFFKQLRELRDGLALATDIPLPHLSMGMTGDFEIAIREGATLVRVGTAVFGSR